MNQSRENLMNVSVEFITSGPYIDAMNKIIFINNLLPSFIFVALALVIGTFGNILVIYVYLFKRNKNTASVFISGMAVIDLANCVVSMTTELALLVNFIKFDHPFSCKLSRYISGINTYTSHIILVAVAVDRYRQICKPTHPSLSLRAARFTVLIALVIGIVAAVPHLIFYGTTTIELKFPFKGSTCLIERRFSRSIYLKATTGLAMIGHLSSDVILVILYSYIGYFVKNRRKNLRKYMYLQRQKYNGVEKSNSFLDVEEKDSRCKCTIQTKEMSGMEYDRSSPEALNDNPVKEKPTNYIDGRRELSHATIVQQCPRGRSSASDKIHTSRKSSKEGKTTFMLFLVTIAFIISFVPHLAIAVLRITNNNLYGELSDTQKVFYQLFLRSYFLSSVLNPIIYSFLGVQFRLDAKALLNKCNKKFSNNK